MAQNIPILSFNSGELSPKIDNRVDTEKYANGCRRLENCIPTKYGGAERRPGLPFIYDASTAPNGRTTTTIRMIPFIYSATIAYTIELGDKYARFYYGDDVLEDGSSNEVWIATPYLEADLFELQYRQIADTLWIVHPSYAPRKLTRTDVYTFELDEIDFRNGPFLTRNDLVNPSDPSTTTLACNVTTAGSFGLLTANSSIFLPGHVGALFQLSHSRATKSTTLSGDSVSDVIRGKGTYNLLTRGTWTGTVIWQRNENNTEWEELESCTGSTDAYHNTISSYEEESNLAKHRLISDEDDPLSAAFRGDLSINQPLESGIVKVKAILNSFTASVEVYSDLASTSATRRWAEGAWSESRGFPGTIGFFEDRCVYSGASKSLTDSEFSAAEYPELRL